MKNRKRVLILCENKNVFNHPLFCVATGFLNLEFIFKVIPSIKDISSNNNIELITVSMDSDTSEKLRKANMPYKNLEEYKPYYISDKLNEHAMSLIRGCNEAKELFFYDGISLWDLIELYLYDMLRKLLLDIEAIKCTFEKEKPDLIMISDHESIRGRATLAIANEMGIPSLKFNHTPLFGLKYAIDRKLKIHVHNMYGRWEDYRRFRAAAKKSLNYMDEKKGLQERVHKVLMLSDELRHAPQVIPWAKELIKKPQISLSIISIDPWPKKYEDLDIHFSTFSHYSKIVPKESEYNVRDIRKNLEKMSTLKEFMIYNGIPIFDVLTYFLSYIFEFYFSKIIKYIQLTRNIINIEKPDLIIVMDDRSWVGKTIVKTCCQKGIPTLITQHGLHTDSPHYGPTNATKMSVYGEYTKNVLVKRGVNARKIIVTGGPQWDGLIKNRPITKKAFCKKFGLDENKKIILLATDIIFLPQESRKVLIGVLNAMKDLPQMQLLIRAHPNEPISLYRSIAKMVNDEVVIFKKPHDIDSINACDLLITQYSTVAMDAIIAGKPVMTINLSENPDPYPYAECGAAYGVYSTKDISSAIRDILNDPLVQQELAKNREDFIRNHVYKNDGKASERVADLIEKMAKDEC